MIIKGKVLKTILISILALLVVMHIMKIITVGKISLNQVTIIICLIFSVAIKTGNKKFYSYGFLVTGVFCILTLPGLTELTPFIFLFLSIYYNSKSIVKFVIPAVLISSFVISFYINEFTDPIDLIVGILGNLGFIALFYFLFINKPVKTPPQLSDIDKNKILLFIMGKTPEQIIKELGLNVQPRTVRTFILDQVKESPCINEMEYAIYFCKMNKIDINLINSI